jgi:hypothetical protein
MATGIGVILGVFAVLAMVRGMRNRKRASQMSRSMVNVLGMRPADAPRFMVLPKGRRYGRRRY